MNKALFKWNPKLSDRQYTILSWWTHPGLKDKDGIIADGAIRSGKTVGMGFSFVMWAMHEFNSMDFAMCGKTIGSLKRNVIKNLKHQAIQRGYSWEFKRSDNLVIISRGDVSNNFWLFGGKDESSQDLIQGITLAGIFFDEVALMPESFVNQATARCSIDGSKWWFNCNPAGPRHWFKVKWINEWREKNLLYLHFTMDDNPSLSEKIKERYARQYAGVFFQRYILGLWVMAEGIIYDMFDKTKHVISYEPKTDGIYYVSADYGIQNATVFLLWGKETVTGRWICLDEWYYSGREKQKQKTVQELVDGLDSLCRVKYIKTVIVDPSATALKVELRKRRYKVRDADNDVLNGIADVGYMFQGEKIAIHERCKHFIKELGIYAWDEKASERGEDRPIKESDHCCDSARYLVKTLKLVKRDKY